MYHLVILTLTLTHLNLSTMCIPLSVGTSLRTQLTLRQNLAVINSRVAPSNSPLEKRTRLLMIIHATSMDFSVIPQVMPSSLESTMMWYVIHLL